MPFASVNDIELYYEVAGDPKDPAILLVAGLGVQLIDWPAHFVDPLVAAGHFVVRYDNRDIGLSTKFDGGIQDPHAVIEAMGDGRDPGVAYTLSDMAADAAGLLEALDIDKAHVIGSSMGGMIAQTIAIEHGHKVASLTSIMSSTGSPEVGQPTPEALNAIVTPAPAQDLESIVAQNLKNAKIWASPGHFDAERLEALFRASWDRAGGPQGANVGRHFCAIIASPPRDEGLRQLDVPALVIHGTADTLVTPSGGEHTAKMLVGSRLVMIEGMGHDLVPAFISDVLDAIISHIAAAVLPAA